MWKSPDVNLFLFFVFETVIVGCTHVEIFYYTNTLTLDDNYVWMETGIRWRDVATLSPFFTRRICSRELQILLRDWLAKTLFVAAFLADQSRCQILVFASRRVETTPYVHIYQRTDCHIYHFKITPNFLNRNYLNSKIEKREWFFKSSCVLLSAFVFFLEPQRPLGVVAFI